MKMKSKLRSLVSELEALTESLYILREQKRKMARERVEKGDYYSGYITGKAAAYSAARDWILDILDDTL